MLVRLRLLIIFACVYAAAFSQVKTDDWGEGDDEEDTLETARAEDGAGPKEDATVTLNGEIFQWKEEVHLQREDTLDISVRHLAAGSRVEIVAEKGGIPIGRKVFYANGKGELDLEVRTGSRKVKGKVTLAYTPGSAPGKERGIIVRVE
ncbi:MAG: hypothetical protein RLZZ165_1037 [Bacteroidota bacterium]